jgi:cytochrome c oxidase subunit IV
MTDPTAMSASDVAEEHATEAHAPYLLVWFALAVLTGIEYFYASFFKDFFLVLILGLLFWAIVKAGLVGWYFMHLKFEGNWVYIMIVPACILATILVMALMPDMAMKPEEEETEAEQQMSLVVPSDLDRSNLPMCRLARGLDSLVLESRAGILHETS